MPLSLFLPKSQPRSCHRPAHLYLVKALSTICAFTLLLPLPAFAGQWVISLSGSTTAPDGANSTYTFVNSQITSPPNATPYFFNLNGSNCSLDVPADGAISLSVTATLTWTPSARGDTSLPSPTLDVLETSSATSHIGTASSVTATPVVSDGLNDTPMPLTTNFSGMQSSGNHVRQFDIAPGQTTVTLPQCSLNASLSWTPANGNVYTPSITVNYGIQIIPLILQAHSTVDTSAPGDPWNPAHPRFFSGTNCSATGTALAVSGYVSEAHLDVGGTDVKDYYDKNFVGPVQSGSTIGTNQTSASLTVYFDSTHFADASNIPIQMLVTDTIGNKYDANAKANAYNKGYVGYEITTNTFGQYGQPTASNVDKFLAASNTKNNDSTTSDTRDAVLAAVTANTDFFTYSYGLHYPDANNHIYFEPPAGVGNSNGVLYGNQSFDPSSTAQNPRNDIAEAVAAKGVNPPPYNFVYLDICNGGYDSEFANGFGLSESGTTDRAFFGWNGWVDDSGFNQNWTTYLYSFLQGGETLNKAIMDADMSPNGRPVDNNMNDASYHSKCPYLLGGDGAMTLHGTVYQGVTGSWFK